MANVTWAFGSEEAARKMFRSELDRIPEAQGPQRARVFLRFGIIEINPDGQAALFAQACAADARLSDHLKEAAQARGPGALRPARQRVAALLRQRWAPADFGSVRLVSPPRSSS